MESFYSVVYLKTNALTDEHLAVGIFTGGGEGPFFFLSEARLKLYKEITRKNECLAIQRMLKGLKREVDKYRGNQSELRLFDPLYSKEELMKVRQLSKGTILFSEPTVINEWLTEEIHKKLVFQFLGVHEKKTISKTSNFHLQWKVYVKQPHFDEYLKNTQVREIKKDADLPILLDLYHLKKKEAVKMIDFDLKSTTLDRKLYELSLITTIFKGHKVICVYPVPKTKIGQQLVQETIENNSKVIFKRFILEF